MQLQASEADTFVAHLYQARKTISTSLQRPNKGNKAIEREVISSFQVAQSLGLEGDFRATNALIRRMHTRDVEKKTVILRNAPQKIERTRQLPFK